MIRSRDYYKRSSLQDLTPGSHPNDDNGGDKGPNLSRRSVLAGVAAIIGVGVVGHRIGTSPEETSSNDATEPVLDDIENQDDLGTFESFMKNYEQIALSVEKQYGVPYQVVLAMGMLESGYGNSDLAKQVFNFHGMKANDEWSGPTFSKFTKEVVNSDWFERTGSDKSQATDLGNGQFEVVVEAKFKKFGSPDEGFKEFGNYLLTRKGGKAFGDAFEYRNDPEAFLLALFDETGYKYATDPSYVEKAAALLRRIMGKEQSPVENQLIIPTWDEIDHVQQRQIGGSEGEFNTIVEQLRQTTPSVGGFSEFRNNIQDISDEVQSMSGAGLVFPGESMELGPEPRIVLHYTAWPESAWGHNGKKFVESIINNAKNNGIVGSANYYLRRLGDKLYVLTKPGRPSFHAGGSYNQEAVGIEVPASSQSDIPAELYEGLVYAVCWHYQNTRPGKKPDSPLAMRKFVIGHGEIAELVPGVTDHSDFPRFVADAIADLSYDLLKKL